MYCKKPCRINSQFPKEELDYRIKHLTDLVLESISNFSWLILIFRKQNIFTLTKLHSVLFRHSCVYFLDEDEDEDDDEEAKLLNKTFKGNILVKCDIKEWHSELLLKGGGFLHTDLITSVTYVLSQTYSLFLFQMRFLLLIKLISHLCLTVFNLGTDQIKQRCSWNETSISAFHEQFSEYLKLDHGYPGNLCIYFFIFKDKNIIAEWFAAGCCVCYFWLRLGFDCHDKYVINMLFTLMSHFHKKIEQIS